MDHLVAFPPTLDMSKSVAPVYGGRSSQQLTRARTGMWILTRTPRL